MSDRRMLDSSGAEWEQKSGLLSLFPTSGQVTDLVEHLQAFIKKIARLESPNPDQLLRVMRAAYMQWQISTSGHLSDLDGTDVEILYEQEQSHRTEWVFRISNQVRFGLKRMESRIPMAMAMAKDVIDVITE